MRPRLPHLLSFIYREKSEQNSELNGERSGVRGRLLGVRWLILPPSSFIRAGANLLSATFKPFRAYALSVLFLVCAAFAPWLFSSAASTLVIQVFSDTFNTSSLTASAPTTYPTTVTAGDGAASINGSSFLEITNDSSATDLSVIKSASPVVVVPGNNITYTIAVTNSGPNSATNAVMDDSIPPNTTFQSISVPAGWTCITPAVNGTGSVHCTNRNLTVQLQNFSLVVKVNSGTAPGSTISNTATVSSDTPDSNSANNSSTTNTNVVAAGSADLAITKSDSPDPVGIGKDLSYTIVVTNNGPAAAANLSVTDSLPSQVTFRSLGGPPAGWTCITPSVGANGSITCTAPSLAAGSTATLPLVVRVNTSVTDGTTISNTANVSATRHHSIASNNS